jgi:hypothetical protein
LLADRFIAAFDFEDFSEVGVEGSFSAIATDFAPAVGAGEVPRTLFTRGLAADELGLAEDGILGVFEVAIAVAVLEDTAPALPAAEGRACVFDI